MALVAHSSLQAIEIFNAWSRRYEDAARMPALASKRPFDGLRKALYDAGKNYTYPVAGMWIDLGPFGYRLDDQCAYSSVYLYRVAREAAEMTRVLTHPYSKQWVTTHCVLDQFSGEDQFGVDIRACVLMAAPIVGRF